MATDLTSTVAVAVEKPTLPLQVSIHYTIDITSGGIIRFTTE